MLAILGDIHGQFSILERAVRDAHANGASALIQVGDFGYYPNVVNQLERANYSLPVYWIDGNHEYFELFYHHKRLTEIHPNVFYVPRGTILDLDGKKIACMGGAASVDKHIRQQYNMHWSELENITPEEEKLLLEADVMPDFMITHCPPQSIIQKHFDPNILRLYFGLPLSWRDPNADVIERIWNHFNKPTLFCGHMHREVADGSCRILDINQLIFVP